MLARAVVYASFLLYLTLGATFNGIVQPQTRLMGLVGVILIGGAWLIRRRRMIWHFTALDAAILVWIVAFFVSLIANPDQWRRIAMGMWYAGVYILAWYLFHDLLANRVITRRALMNALLLAGVLIVAFGYLQSRTWFSTTLPLILNRTLEFSLPRPVSTLGNANTLGAFLAVLLPFALESVRASKGIIRTLMAFYALLIGGLLLLTYSRGAWVGAAAGVCLYVILLAWRAGWLSPRRWRDFWAAQSVAAHTVVTTVVLSMVVIGAAGGVIIARSYLAPGGRSVDARAWIYDTAWRMFSEQPLTGSGLFTFGTGIARYNGNPPYEPHAHAHNLLLHTAAELGVIGLLALAITVMLAVRATLVIVRPTSGTTMQLGQHDPVVIAGAGGVAAFAVHHLFDVPILNPVIALICLTALAIATVPLDPIPLVGIRQQMLRLAVPMGAITLALTGLWSVLIYQQYAAIISQTASGVISPLDGAQQLRSVVDADPNMALYVYEQGFLYGLAGETQAGIAAFERYTRLDPDYATGWLNLFALYKQAGDLERAHAAILHAHQVSLDEPNIEYQLAEMQALIGDREGAQQSYHSALVSDPDLSMLPDWGHDPLRVQVLADTPQTATTAGSIIRQIRSGDLATAREGWEYYRSITPSPTSAYVLEALFALRNDNRSGAEAALAAAQASVQGQGDGAWARYGKACLARFYGDEMAVRDEIAAAWEALELDPFETDWQFGANIGYTQLMRLMIPRVFLPEVEYPLVSPVLIGLLEAFATTPETRYSSCP